jgi:hypothetical protein
MAAILGGLPPTRAFYNIIQLVAGPSFGAKR